MINPDRLDDALQLALGNVLDELRPASGLSLLGPTQPPPQPDLTQIEGAPSAKNGPAESRSDAENAAPHEGAGPSVATPAPEDPDEYE